MKVVQLPIALLLVLAVAIVAVMSLFTAMIDQAYLRGAYQVWQENETFAAATIALLAALLASRPVYMQVRAQSVQAALDLLHRTEADAEACIDARKMLFELRRVALALAGEINGYAAAAAPSTPDLKAAIAAFQAIPAKDLRTLAERPTITSADHMKIVALSCVLSLTQQMAADILAGERGGVITKDVVATERELIGGKLAGLFGLSSEIAEDLEAQEEAMRDRAQQLRRSADTMLV